MGKFGFEDEWGPKWVIHVHIPELSLEGVLVVDNVAAGPSIGGLRMAPDVTTEECFRLARSMTFKNAAAGLAHGGGKSVLRADPSLPAAQKELRIRAFASALGDVEDYIFGPDMGTDEAAMACVKDEIGRAVGLPRELGGIPLDELGATGFGVVAAIEAALPHLGFELPGARVAIQGFGAVGRHAARLLMEKGARLVAVSDSRGALLNENGLDVAALLRAKSEGMSVRECAGGVAAERDAVIDAASDIWIPAARPDVIDRGNVERLNTKLVAQGANIPVTLDAERYLHAKGVLSLPDFIASAGGVICAAMEYRGASEAAAFDAIEEKLRRNVRELLNGMKEKGVTPRQAALDLAEARLKTAMRSRRWSIF